LSGMHGFLFKNYNSELNHMAIPTRCATITQSRGHRAEC
jgi:hypothetical protein